MPAKTARNVYAPRARELIRATGNPDLFPELNIPRSTISGWLRGDFKPAVGAEAVAQTEIEVHARLAKLERRIQILIVESNALLEVWWRSLRHQWLYLNTLDTVAAVRRVVSIYVAEHNQVPPHSALNGRTPDEVYLRQAEDMPAKLAVARKVARDERLAANRALSCAACTATGTSDANQASAA